MACKWCWAKKTKRCVELEYEDLSCSATEVGYDTLKISYCCQKYAARQPPTTSAACDCSHVWVGEAAPADTDGARAVSGAWLMSTNLARPPLG